VRQSWAQHLAGKILAEIQLCDKSGEGCYRTPGSVWFFFATGDSSMSATTVLANGAKLPSIGFGFWKVEKDLASDVTVQAIEAGYRHLDCACDYGNEAEVGQGIAAALDQGLCRRDDLWVTSKLWNTYHAAEHVRPACERSLRDLQLDYLDLYLIHFPIATRFVPFETRYPPEWFYDPTAAEPKIEEVAVPILETWRAMEELVDQGLVKQIGVCNFGTSLLRDLLASARIRPSVLQVEMHPYLTQDKLLRYCQQQQIACTAFSPLGAQSYFSLGMADPSEAVLQNSTVMTISSRHSRTPAQVVLRWAIQRGVSIVPKSVHAERMRENLALFDFELTDQEMRDISALDQGRRFNDPGHFCEVAFNTFLPIYE
jgi:D-xylose reductase